MLLLPTWLIVLITILSVLVFGLILWGAYSIYSRKQRKVHRKDFEEKVYTHEKERAEKALDALRTANIARAGQPSYCTHGYSISTEAYQSGMPLAVEYGGCAACYNAGYYQTPYDSDVGHARMARTNAEIPRGPPPVAPPGFVTVPMVIGNR